MCHRPACRGRGGYGSSVALHRRRELEVFPSERTRLGTSGAQRGGELDEVTPPNIALVGRDNHLLDLCRRRDLPFPMAVWTSRSSDLRDRIARDDAVVVRHPQGRTEYLERLACRPPRDRIEEVLQEQWRGGDISRVDRTDARKDVLLQDIVVAGLRRVLEVRLAPLAVFVDDVGDCRCAELCRQRGSAVFIQ